MEVSLQADVSRGICSRNVSRECLRETAARRAGFGIFMVKNCDNGCFAAKSVII